jgi:very-short-patch-repair endonuclease
MHASVIDAAGAPNPSQVAVGSAADPAALAAPRGTGLPGLQKRRLQALIDYVQQSARSRARVVGNVTDHGLFLLFQHQVGSIDGLRLDDAGPDGEDEIWLTVPRPPSPELPPRPDNPWLAPWLAVGIAVLVAPKLLDATEGAALIAAGTHRDASQPADGMAEMMKPAVLPGERIEREHYAFRSEVEKQFAHYLDSVWVPWADAERRRRRLSRVYVQLFSLHQQLAGALVEAPVELVWGVGLGVVNRAQAPIAYPVITRLVDLTLDEGSGAIEVRPRDLEARVELDFYTAGEREAGDGDRSLVHQAEQVARDLLARSPNTLSPFDASGYEPVLAAVRDVLAGQQLARRPELALTSEPDEAKLPPLKIDAAWVLFARPRSGNLVIQDLDRFHRALEHIDAMLPDAVAALVTDPATAAAPVELPRFRGVSAPLFQRGSEADGAPLDLYFPKPFNDEQVRIVQLLEAHEGVVVQGPPGTGKTHTIANIICHWLATGRRVLVTSMKEPALAVLRDKLPEEIQPLAIALLGSEYEGMRQFEQSIQTIASQVQSLDRYATAGEVAQLEETVDGLHARLARIDTEIGRWARLNQARIDIDGESISPMDAAQEVIDHAGQYEWLPDPLGIGPQHAPRFAEDDIARLRQARHQLAADIDYVGRELPALGEFPDARTLLNTHQGLVAFTRRSAAGVGDRPQLASLATATADLRDLAALLERVKALREDTLAAGSAWVPRMQMRLRDGAHADEVALLDKLGRELLEVAARRKLFLARPVAAPVGAETDVELLQAIDNLAGGRRAFGLMAGFSRSDARRQLEAVRVSGQLPAEADDWKHVGEYLALLRKLRELGARWNAVAADLGLEPVRTDQPQDVLGAAGQFALYRKVRLLVDAQTELAQRARRLFPSWPAAARVADDAGAAAQLEATIEHHQTAQQLGEVWVAKARLQKALEGRSGRIVEDLRVFLADLLGDPKVDESGLLGPWAALMAELSRLHRLAPALQVVTDVTQRIAQSGAPLWAQRLGQPVDGAVDALLPSDWRRAWRLRSLATHLALIDPQDEFRKLARLRSDLEHDLARAYGALTVKRSWLKLAENATPAVRAALQAYLNAIQRLGKGTGKRAARYRQDARNAAAEANAAIPCWIMPHHRVSESLPAQLGCFDLVVIDEASQSDLSALPSLFRGRKLLIVGDDKQVSPEGVGLEEERIKSLMQRYLAEQVPVYRAQMSADRSIYDLARVVFARSGVMLKEHFRCVAPIIEYSKREFYAHELQPLRLPPASQRLDPPLVDVLVEDGRREGDLNPAEGRYIVDEIKRLVAQPRHAQRSIGVVSLLGDEQALRIWDLLNEELGPQVLQRYGVACGDARTFQGRERDIMFLSMVSAPNDVGAQLSRETFAQRFNVAASRARDRMYLVRSVELHHLAEGDRLRRGLLAHFASPFLQQPGQAADPRELCESPLEREVYDWLVARGYRVRPQVQVGTYRIDLVVEGGNDARLAVECDGDKYHGAEKWTSDVRRQRVLERAGWTFWRCFASTLVRRREAALEELSAALAAQGIHPAPRGAGQAVPAYTELRRVRGLG